MFHSHHDEMTQMAMGMIGMFVVHPRNPSPEADLARDGIEPASDSPARRQVDPHKKH
jgi:FtsP/CotA-like multicopper oxidase with cupredoxin domain